MAEQETAVEKFLDFFGIITQCISRRELGNVLGPQNVDVLYSRFAKAWKEVYPDFDEPKIKP